VNREKIETMPAGDMTRSLAGRTAIVTGAAQGMGRAISFALSRRGANVVVADLNESTAGRVVEELQAEGAKALAIWTDVSSAEQVQEMVAHAVKEFGALHILINNAGVLRPSRVGEITEAEWDIVGYQWR